MRSPVVHLAHNLRWTRYGTVWADWRIAGLPYGFRPDTDKQEIRALHQALLRALPGESLLASVATQVDPVDVVERMIAGIDLEQCPDWATECEATFDTLDQLAPGGRVFWLSVPLGHTSSWSWVTEATAAAGTSVRDALALPRAPDRGEGGRSAPHPGRADRRGAAGTVPAHAGDAGADAVAAPARPATRPDTWTGRSRSRPVTRLVG